MKELSIEQKARAYDEAIERANSLLSSNELGNAWIYKLLPELKESKEDERIRKWIVRTLKSLNNSSIQIDGAYEMMLPAIAWLEKKDEKKPADKPKFKAGDIIKPKDGSHEPWQIMQVDMLDKKYRFKNGYVIHFSQEDAYELVEQKPAEVRTTVYWYVEDIKKEWSEEDEKMLNDIIMCGERHCYLDAENIAWLKNLKNHVQPQNSNITDEKLAQAKKDAYNDALDKIEYHSGEPTFDDGWSAAIWYLKKRNAILHPQWKPNNEQMDALHYVTNFDYGGHKATLVSLYEQLKKL